MARVAAEIAKEGGRIRMLDPNELEFEGIGFAPTWVLLSGVGEARLVHTGRGLELDLSFPALLPFAVFVFGILILAGLFRGIPWDVVIMAFSVFPLVGYLGVQDRANKVAEFIQRVVGA